MLLPIHISYGQAITGDEFDSIASQIIASQGKIQSLQMSCVGRVATDGGEMLTRKIIYARSGEKEYCKTFWPTKPGEPDSTRYHVALWDGQKLLSYESRAHNGAIRAQRSANPTDPQTYSDVCRYFGHLTKGNLQELLRRVPAEQWSAAWVEPGKTLTLTCDTLPRVGSHERSEWVLDASKGFMVSRYRSLWQDPNDRNKYDQVLEMVVTADKEVLPGVWIPTQSHQEYKTPAFRSDQGVTTVIKDLAITDMHVNDPTVEELFTFQWPKGAQYYDYTLKSTVIPHATDEAMEQHINEMARDMHSTAAVPTEQKVDDATHSMSEHPSTVPSQSPNAVQGNADKSNGLLLWLIPAVIVGAVCIGLLWFRSTHHKSKGEHV
jgi:hypothetical protein